MLRRLILASVLVAGCTVAPPTAPPASPPPTMAPASVAPPTVTPTASPTPVPPTAVVAGVVFPATAFSTPWKIVGLTADPSDPYKSVSGMKPPAGLYVLEFLSEQPCTGFLSGGGSTWSLVDKHTGFDTNLTLADLVKSPDGYEALALGCRRWGLSLHPLESYFGPKGTQVARFMVLSDNLASDWQGVGDEVVTPEALAIERQVLDAALRDPNLAAAIKNATARHWYLGNRYLEQSATASTLRRLAITAEVALPLLTIEAFKVLYGPMASYVDPLGLGVPVKR